MVERYPVSAIVVDYLQCFDRLVAVEAEIVVRVVDIDLLDFVGGHEMEVEGERLGLVQTGQGIHRGKGTGLQTSGCGGKLEVELAGAIAYDTEQ